MSLIVQNLISEISIIRIASFCFFASLPSPASKKMKEASAEGIEFPIQGLTKKSLFTALTLLLYGFDFLSCDLTTLK